MTVTVASRWLGPRATDQKAADAISPAHLNVLRLSRWVRALAAGDCQHSGLAALNADDHPPELRFAPQATAGPHAALARPSEDMGRIALSRSGCRDVQLWFYTDVLVLRNDLILMIARDDFGRLAIVPMYRVVDDWGQTHRIHRAPYGTLCERHFAPQASNMSTKKAAVGERLPLWK
jgi:hypothetical protein